MKNKTEKYVADAYKKMESAMKDLGMKPEDSTSHNDTGSSLWSKEFDIQVFTPNSLVRDDDKEEYNTFVVWCDGTEGEGDYLGEVMGQTLLETIALLTEELAKRKVECFDGWLMSKGMRGKSHDIYEDNIGVSMVIAVPPSTELKEIDELVKWGEDLGWSLNDYEARGDNEWYMEFIVA